MGSIVQADVKWVKDIIQPVPGEAIRAGGGIQSPEDITGNAGDDNGTVTYSGLIPFVRVRHVNAGNSQTLLATVTGNDISVRLATSNVGVVTSTANQVVAEVLAKATGLVDAVARGTGNGLAGVKDWVQVSAGAEGSVYPTFRDMCSRELQLKEYADQNMTYHTQLALHERMQLLTASTATITRFKVPSYYGFFSNAGTPTRIFYSGLSQSVLSAANLEPAGAFVANTWYYLYLDGTSGVGIDKITTTPPDDDRLFMTGNTYYRYVGCFRTNASAQITTFRKQRNRTTYLQKIEEYTNQALSTDVNAPNFFACFYAPPKCTWARLRLVISNSNNATQTMYWTHNSSLGTWYGYQIPAQSTVWTEIVVSSKLLPNQNPAIEFETYATAANMSLVSIQMMEFME